MPVINIVMQFVFPPVSWVMWLACYDGKDGGDSGVQRMERN